MPHLQAAVPRPAARSDDAARHDNVQVARRRAIRVVRPRCSADRLRLAAHKASSSAGAKLAAANAAARPRALPEEAASGLIRGLALLGVGVGAAAEIVDIE